MVAIRIRAQMEALCAQINALEKVINSKPCLEQENENAWRTRSNNWKRSHDAAVRFSSQLSGGNFNYPTAFGSKFPLNFEATLEATLYTPSQPVQSAEVVE